jgi:diacylglycerol kinase family enzyme
MSISTSSFNHERKFVMGKILAMYNPLAGNNTGEERAKQLEKFYSSESIEYVDLTKLESVSDLVLSIDSEGVLILCGGDGTLNRFINLVDTDAITCKVMYFPVGSGNDFARDMGHTADDAPFDITDCIKNLPTACVKGNTYRFINGVGYGIDGYCCEVGDKIRAEKPGKPINYTGIAIKGLLFYFKPGAATITVDGVKHEYKKCWIAPTMHGRFYGGGMIAAPKQDRAAEDGKLSLMVFHDSSPLKTLMIFPKIFKGEHVNSKKYVEVIEGYDISVEFEKPCALQVDGETVLNVSSYTAKATARKPAEV